MSQVLFLAAHVVFIALGAAVVFHPALRPLAVWGRLGIAFGAGAVALTVFATFLSLVGVDWSRASLGLPLLLLAGALAWMWRRRGTGAPSLGPATAAVWVAGVVTLLALGHLGLSLLTSRATSADYLFFWGVKGVRFAAASGIDTEFLKWPFAVHTHVNYPPLVPTTYAWAALWAGRLPWRVGLLVTFLWFAAAVPVVLELLRQRLSNPGAAAVTSFWTVAMAVSLASSYSGGNAEAPLVFFLTVAGAALLVEDGPWGASRFLAPLALAGAVLTKNEGAMGAGLLILGVVVRDLMAERGFLLRAAGGAVEALRRAGGRVARRLPLVLAPLLAWGLWALVEIKNQLPLSDPIREAAFQVHFGYLKEIVTASLVHLGAGTWGLSWLLPLGFLAAGLATRRQELSRLLPGTVFVMGLLGFTFFYYLHSQDDPTLLIEWTLSRLSQPALSVLILVAGLAFFAPESQGDAR